jgi:ankyrin repeat protein
VEVASFLVGRVADNIRIANNDTAVHYVAILDSVDIIRLLLDKGMYVDLTKRKKYTPVQFLFACGNLEASKAFVQRWSFLYNINKYGNTPMTLAARNANYKSFVTSHK